MLPSLVQMLQQALTAELRQHVNRINARVDEITQDEIDDPVLAAKRHSRLGALLRKWIKPASPAASEDNPEHPQSHGKVIVAIRERIRNKRLRIFG
jgi:hypothetical protein